MESLSPHRAAAVGVNGELIDELDAARGLHGREAEAESYVEAILENLRRAGVHQKDKGDRIAFTALKPWPGELICAEGRYPEGETERRAGIFIGPEYGTVQRADLVAAAREAAEAGFDVVIACAFNFDAHASEFHRLGRVPVLQARMNPDLHMAGDLKAGGGNLFTIFGEPDIEILAEGDTLRVALRGVDIFKPSLGRVDSSDADEIACWFIDTDYNEEILLRPPRLLPRRRHPLQGDPHHPEGRDRRGRLGEPQGHRLPPVPEAEVRAYRREGHQPPRRRGDEGVCEL